MSGEDQQEIQYNPETRRLVGEKGAVTGVSREEYLRMRFLEGMDKAKRTRLKRDRQAEVSRAKGHLKGLETRSQVSSALQGLSHGLLHGFTDDYERWSVNDKTAGSDATLADKIYQATGKKMAVNNILAKTDNPLAFHTGQFGGMGLAALGTRGAFQSVGQVRKGINKARHGGDLKILSQKQADEALALRNANAERMGRAYMGTNRRQAQVFDAGHGALLGYGGVHVDHDEDALSAERGMRALIGGLAGYAFAPSEAALWNYGGQGSKYLQQQLGFNPRTPLRKSKLRDGVEPDDALRTVLSRDEAAARGVRDGGQGIMRGDQSNPLLYAEGQNTRGLVDHAIASEGGANVVTANLGDVTAKKRTGRLAAAPGGADRARAAVNAERQSMEIPAFRDEIVARTPAVPGSQHPAERALTQIEGRKLSQTQIREDEKIGALMQAFDSRDGAVARDWGATFNKLTKDGQQMVRHEIGNRLLAKFDAEGVQGVQRFVNDPQMSRFFGQYGFRAAARFLRSGGANHPKIKRLAEMMDNIADQESQVARRDPFYGNKQDQKLARYEMDAGDAQRIAQASMPKSSFNIPDYVPPMDNSARLLQATRASLGDYLRQASRDTGAKLSGKKDFSVSDVTVGGMLAGLTETGLEHIVSPHIRNLFELLAQDERTKQELLSRR